tara:strand:+ start:1632 stop:1826 length:195 start_codon:yes stop_codon:yes gene_type:complete
MDELLVLLCFALVIGNVCTVLAFRFTIDNIVTQMKDIVLEREESLREQVKDDFNPLKDEPIYRM